jgi:hypothetical protein
MIKIFMLSLALIASGCSVDTTELPNSSHLPSATSVSDLIKSLNLPEDEPTSDSETASETNNGVVGPTQPIGEPFFNFSIDVTAFSLQERKGLEDIHVKAGEEVNFRFSKLDTAYGSIYLHKFNKRYTSVKPLIDNENLHQLRDIGEMDSPQQTDLRCVALTDKIQCRLSDMFFTSKTYSELSDQGEMTVALTIVDNYNGHITARQKVTFTGDSDCDVECGTAKLSYNAPLHSLSVANEPVPNVEDLKSSGIRFNDYNEGTVVDKTTGLMWMKNAGCWGNVSWDHAEQIAQDTIDCADYAGHYNDWRIPTKEEWRGLIIDGDLPEEHPFTHVKDGYYDYYWSSSTAYYSNNGRQLLNLNYYGLGKYSDMDTGRNNVWLVRGEEKGAEDHE